MKENSLDGGATEGFRRMYKDVVAVTHVPS